MSRRLCIQTSPTAPALVERTKSSRRLLLILEGDCSSASQAMVARRVFQVYAKNQFVDVDCLDELCHQLAYLSSAGCDDLSNRVRSLYFLFIMEYPVKPFLVHFCAQLNKATVEGTQAIQLVNLLGMMRTLDVVGRALEKDIVEQLISQINGYIPAKILPTILERAFKLGVKDGCIVEAIMDILLHKPPAAYGFCELLSVVARYELLKESFVDFILLQSWMFAKGHSNTCYPWSLKILARCTKVKHCQSFLKPTLKLPLQHLILAMWHRLSLTDISSLLRRHQDLLCDGALPSFIVLHLKYDMLMKLDTLALATVGVVALSGQERENNLTDFVSVLDKRLLELVGEKKVAAQIPLGMLLEFLSVSLERGDKVGVLALTVKTVNQLASIYKTGFHLDDNVIMPLLSIFACLSMDCMPCFSLTVLLLAFQQPLEQLHHLKVLECALNIPHYLWTDCASSAVKEYILRNLEDAAGTLSNDTPQSVPFISAWLCLVFDFFVKHQQVDEHFLGEAVKVVCSLSSVGEKLKCYELLAQLPCSRALYVEAMRDISAVASDLSGKKLMFLFLELTLKLGWGNSSIAKAAWLSHTSTLAFDLPFLEEQEADIELFAISFGVLAGSFSDGCLDKLFDSRLLSLPARDTFQGICCRLALAWCAVVHERLTDAHLESLLACDTTGKG